MKAIIIDDERKARNVLKILVEENCSKITEIFQAENLLDGVELIKKEKPDIVFLDIEMPEHSGLEILDFLDKEIINFEIIFTTAYSEYAIQAFQLSAIDYILKPVTPIQVREAVQKAVDLIGKSQINVRLEELRKSLSNTNFTKIALPFSEGIKFVDFKDIIMLEADGMYTKISTKYDNELLVSKPLKYFSDIFKNESIFYKPHRSFMINLMFVKEFIKKDGGYIVMDNNNMVSLSKDKKEEFLALVMKTL